MIPVLKDIVLLGAGHAHVGVLRSFGMKPMPGVRLTLVTREIDTPYSGMLPGLITGYYDFDDVHIDTGPLSRFAGARLYHAEATDIDIANRRLICRDRPAIPFDLLSINIGSTPGGAGIDGAAAKAIPVKPIDRFLGHFEAARRRILARQGVVRIGTVGGGAAGVELALSLEARLRRDVAAVGGDSGALRVTLLTGATSIVPSLPSGARQRLLRILKERDIEVMADARVTDINGSSVSIAGAAPIDLDEVFWATQARPADWLTNTGLALDGSGFVEVRDTLQSISHPGIFAVGDIASMTGRDLPKSGVYAVRQGPFLAENLRRSLAGRSMRRYRPQSDALYLVSTGDRYAVGARNGMSFEGKWVWRWKDRIDRKFMTKFNQLPDMPEIAAKMPSGLSGVDLPQEMLASGMRCGGCGAKVGADVLSRALAQIRPVDRSDVVLGLDAPDDAALVDTGGGQHSVRTVDYFRSFVDDPYTFGRIAAIHALGDIHAMGAKPQTALAIATVPFGIESKTEIDLLDMMTGANEVLSAEDCAIIGGHTGEGAELALGFAITGELKAGTALRKCGLRPGDALILTKPIGTGTLMAADMRGKAKARWVMSALRRMTQSNRSAAEILRRHAVSAATDITGFGLIGHLDEMAQASDVEIRLRLSAIPLLDGVLDTAGRGLLSSLHPQNLRMRCVIANADQADTDPVFPLLFDPQTAGGLLAAVPADQAASCVGELRRSGYEKASVIGVVLPHSAALARMTLDLEPSPNRPEEPALYGAATDEAMERHPECAMK